MQLDYVILLSENIYNGLESHKTAVIEAFKILNDRHVVGNKYGFHAEIEKDKMKATLSNLEELLQLPTDEYYDTRPEGNRCLGIPNPLPYTVK